MNILGVGGPEFLIIVLIMIVIAGPRRMVRWMYILGTYIAKFRQMWSETVDVLQQEFDDAGVGIQLPKEVPTRGNIKRQAASMVSSVSNPIKETMDQVKSEVSEITAVTKETADSANKVVQGANGHSRKSTKPASTPKKSDKDNFGTWSNQDKKTNFGSWSGNGQEDKNED